MSKNWRLRLPLWLAGALAAAGAAAVLYYLLWPARGAFFADTTDTLYWAQASFDSGRLIDPEFAYATLLPMGGSLLMLPFFPLFGMSMATHLIGMALFALLFMAALWFFCTSLPMAAPGRLALFGVLLLGLCASAKLREIMWEHVIYYSLGILFSLWMLGVLFRLLFPKAGRKVESAALGRREGLWLAALGLLGFLCGLDGPQVAVFCALPAGLAVLAERYFDPERKLAGRANRPAYLAAGVLLGASALGMAAARLMWGGVETVYSDSYLVFSPPGSWAEHVLGIAESWMTLLGLSVAGGENLVSPRAAVELARILAAGVLFFLPLAAACWYARIRSRRVRLLLWYHWALTAATLGSHIFGRTYDTNWRMTPMAASALVVTVVLLRHGWMRGGQLPVLRRAVALGAAALGLFCAISLYGIVRLPPNYGQDGKLYQLTQTLEAHGLTQGYSGFETAHSVTVLSGERVKVRLVDITEEGISPRMYQTRASWYGEAGADGRSFLISTEEYLAELAGASAWQALAERELERIPCGEFTIVVYSGNIV